MATTGNTALIGEDYVQRWTVNYCYYDPILLNNIELQQFLSFCFLTGKYKNNAVLTVSHGKKTYKYIYFLNKLIQMQTTSDREYKGD